VRRLVRALGPPFVHQPWVVAAIWLGTVLAFGAAAVSLILPGHDPGPRRLTSLQPTQAEEEELSLRFQFQGLDVPLLRRFLKIVAAEKPPPSDLELALERYVEYLQMLKPHSETADTGESGDSGDCQNAMRLIQGGRFEEAETAFSRGISRAESNTQAAWCLWLDGLSQAMQRRTDAANDRFTRSLEEMETVRTAAGSKPEKGQFPPGPVSRLRVKVLRSAARTADQSGNAELARSRINAAVEAARSAGDGYSLELVIEAADMLDRCGARADALRRRKEALNLAEETGRRREAREQAQAIVEAYDTAGKKDEANTLRERYGLAPPR